VLSQLNPLRFHISGGTPNPPSQLYSRRSLINTGPN